MKRSLSLLLAVVLLLTGLSQSAYTVYGAESDWGEFDIAAEPEIVEQETVEPEIIDSETAEPETAEPEIVEQETVEPEIFDEEIIDSETAEPEIIEPEIIYSETGDSEAYGFEVIDSEIIDSELYDEYASEYEAEEDLTDEIEIEVENAESDEIISEEDELSLEDDASYVPITSVTIKDPGVLSPMMLGDTLTSELTVNDGADITNLGIKYTDETGAPAVFQTGLVDIEIKDGKLQINPYKNPAGSTSYFIFYDKNSGNEPPIPIGEKVYEATIQKPVWTAKMPNASLISSDDRSLTFKVTNATKFKFDTNYWIAVQLKENSKTKLKDGLHINYDTGYFQINADGTFPAISMAAFMDAEFGKGCGTSMDAEIYIVAAKGDPEVYYDILAESEHRKLTVSTKAPNYADKITLKKGTTNLYAGDKNVVIATVNLGKNVTFNRPEDWDVDNFYCDEGITISKDEDGYELKASINKDVKPGTYKAYVKTVIGDVEGIPALASIEFKVLPTVTKVVVDPVIMYHQKGKNASYTLKPVATDQTGDAIKSPTYSYVIGEYDGSEIKPVTGLTATKGKINISNIFDFDSNKNYKLRVSCKCGQEVSTLIPVTIIENRIDLNKCAFYIGNTIIEDTLTLAEYYGAVSDIVIKDSNGNNISKDLLKEIKIPGPDSIKKAGKITLSATAIDGTKLTKSINITATESGADFSKLHLTGYICTGTNSLKDYFQNVAENNTVDVTGEPTNAVYSLWLSNENDTRNTFTEISGNKLTVSGAKIINNYHNDYLTFVMTGKTATITLTKGKSKEKYTVVNGLFNKNAPKFNLEKKKLYTNFKDFQTIRYDFIDMDDNLAYDLSDQSAYALASDNKAVQELIDAGCIIFHKAQLNNQHDDGSRDPRIMELKINPIASQTLKAGTYPLSVTFLNTNEYYGYPEKALCKSFKITLKLENLKKSFKFDGKYKVSCMDAKGFELKYKESGFSKFVVDNFNPFDVLDDNIKGQYNGMSKMFDVSSGSTDTEIKYAITIVTEEIPSNMKSITGYLRYTVEYIDGTRERHQDKITVDISRKALKKYKTEPCTISLSDDTYTIEDVHVYDSGNTRQDFSKADVLDAKTKNMLIPYDGNQLVGIDVVGPTLSFKLNKDKITKPGKITLKFNVIMASGIYDAEEKVTAENSVPVTVTITVTK